MSSDGATGQPVCWFVGLTTLDVIHRVAAAPRPNEKVTALRQDVAAGGPSANAAVVAAALGARSVLVTALGESPVAVAARADLEAHGVTVIDSAGIGSARGDFLLPVSSVAVDEVTGERSVVSADGALSVAPAIDPGVLYDLPTPDVIQFDGHHPELALSVLGWQVGCEPRPFVVLDAGRWREVFRSLIPEADVVAASADFALPDDLEGLEDFEAGERSWLTTDGSAPVTWRGSSGRIAVFEVPPVGAVDTLGAGDAFHGALCKALAGGAEMPDAISEAIRVAGVRVASVGPRAWLRDL